MFLLGWIICWIFLILRASAGSLEVLTEGGPEVTCSQGLSECSTKDVMPLSLANDEAFDIVNLTPDFKLCCKDGAPCTLCMAVHIEMKLPRDEGNVTEQLKDGEEPSKPKAAAVTACYAIANLLPACKQVNFRVSRTQQEAKVSILVKRRVGLTFSSNVMVYSAKDPRVRRQVFAPSINEVCSQEMAGRLEECDVPKVRVVINIETNQVELQPAAGAQSLPSMCVQQESDGHCESWNRMNIPLHSVSPCTCFQVLNYSDKGQRRSLICPFKSTDFIMKNALANVSVSCRVQTHMTDGRPRLRWTLSAPCKLVGEVWPCCPLRGCSELQGFRQHLSNGKWSQNGRSGYWERTDEFEGLSHQLTPYLMVVGRDSLLGPYCNSAEGRWHWIPLIFGVVLLLCLTVLVVYLTRNFIKKWVWRWHHGRFVKIGRKGPVLLLSPPDVDDGVSRSVCDLGSLLRQQGFSVTLDSCCRQEQCDLGPIPWLHSQMLQLNRQHGRAVLVLTPAAVERALEWDLQDQIKEEEGDHPHAAVFKSSLFLIKTDRQLGRSGEHFVLVTFDSDLCRKSRLPELLWGLRRFQLPLQTRALLTELAVGGRNMGTGQRALRSRASGRAATTL